MIAVIKERHTIVVASGSGSANTLKCSGCELIQVYTKATTSTNIYDLEIIDEDGETIWEQLAIEGEYEEHAIYIPLRGVYTIQISNATIDEVIVAKLMIE